MTAGDIGATIICNAGGFSMLGGTATLIGTPNPPGEPITLGPTTISEDGLLATYTSTGADITAGGPWEFRLRVVTNTGEVFTSAPARVYIFPL